MYLSKIKLSYTGEMSLVSAFLPIAVDGSTWRFEEDYPGKAGWIGTDETNQVSHLTPATKAAGSLLSSAPTGVISFSINVSHHAEIAVGYLSTFDNTGTPGQ